MPPARKHAAGPRSAARLAAVQALYQREMEPAATRALIAEFRQHRLGRAIEDDDPKLIEPEPAFFDDLVAGVDARAGEIDALIVEHLAAGWSLDRLDRPTRAMLRAGVYELIARADIGVPTIINEYVEVARAFLGPRETGFVNALLDAVAKRARAPVD